MRPGLSGEAIGGHANWREDRSADKLAEWTCMCTVLTNAPLPTENRPIVMPKCGKCTVCKNVCQAEAIHGSTWKIGMDRDLIVDVYHCNTCLKCLTNCPWTQKHMKKILLRNLSAADLPRAYKKDSKELP